MEIKTLDQLISETLEKYDFGKKAYFMNLADGGMNKEQFILTQKQFYFAVIHFASPLAFVAGNIPTYEDRISIIKNLWEEHGEGNLKHSHGETFIEFLKRLSSKPQVEVPAPQEAVLKFNLTLDEVSKNGHFLKAVAAIGMIERMFADISSHIGTSVIERGWMKSQDMIHYTLHEELDCIHAEDFFSILRGHYSSSNRELILEGLTLGAQSFLDLYSQLWEQVSKNEILISTP